MTNVVDVDGHRFHGAIAVAIVGDRKVIAATAATCRQVRRRHGPAVEIRRIAVAVALGRRLCGVAGTGIIDGGGEVDAGEIFGARRIGQEQHSDTRAGGDLGRQVHADGVADGIVGKGHRGTIHEHVGNGVGVDAEGSRHRNRHAVHTGIGGTDRRVDVVLESISPGVGRYIVRVDLGHGSRNCCAGRDRIIRRELRSIHECRSR